MATSESRPEDSDLAGMALRVSWVGVSAIVLYIAALGPLVSLADRGYLPKDLVRGAYKPLPRSIGLKSLRAWAHYDSENFRHVIWEDQ